MYCSQWSHKDSNRNQQLNNNSNHRCRNYNLVSEATCPRPAQSMEEPGLYPACLVGTITCICRCVLCFASCRGCLCQVPVSRLPLLSLQTTRVQKKGGTCFSSVSVPDTCLPVPGLHTGVFSQCFGLAHQHSPGIPSSSLLFFHLGK